VIPEMYLVHNKTKYVLLKKILLSTS